MIFSAIGVLKGLLSLASAVAGYAKDRQLLDAGAAAAIAKGNTDGIALIDKANQTRNRVRDTLRRNPGSLHEDDEFRTESDGDAVPGDLPTNPVERDEQ